MILYYIYIKIKYSKIKNISYMPYDIILYIYIKIKYNKIKNQHLWSNNINTSYPTTKINNIIKNNIFMIMLKVRTFSIGPDEADL